METGSFYAAVGSIGFTLLGLWWVVVQSRPEWRDARARRFLAYVISLHFMLPASMSLLSLVAPDVAWVWRVAFAAAGLLGIVSVLLLLRALREEYDSPAVIRYAQWIVLPAYAAATIFALAPELAANLGLGLTARQVESIVVMVILGFGVQSAWFLLVEPLRKPA